MRALFLVGESLPAGMPVVVGGNANFVAFDARHGVFPNLVMKPLLAALLAMRKEGQNEELLWQQIDELVADPSDRRFNLFHKYPSAKKDNPHVCRTLRT